MTDCRIEKYKYRMTDELGTDCDSSSHLGVDLVQGLLVFLPLALNLILYSELSQLASTANRSSLLSSGIFLSTLLQI
jgi:hypothetical protein